jgi:tetratricopeptide (TPR) repeat protein
VQKLQPPDTHHLLAATGWVELGNYDEADAELDKIQPLARVHPDVLKVRWSVYALARKWEAAFDIAIAIRRKVPNDPVGWVHVAYCLHEVKRTQEALEALLPAEPKFPKCEMIPYNLACYMAQLGELHSAKCWLNRAILIGNSTELKRMALCDKDLEPLWKEIGNL